MIEAADTRRISQVESPGFQALLRRVRDASRDGPATGPAIGSVEQLAQLLALWRPGAAGQASGASYLAARFGGQRPAYFHPALAGVLYTDTRSPSLRGYVDRRLLDSTNQRRERELSGVVGVIA